MRAPALREAGSPTKSPAALLRKPTIAFDVGYRGSSFIEVRDLSPGDLAVLDAGGPLETVFRVSVAPSTASDGPELPAIFGQYEMRGDAIRFHPHFPFEPGISYTATFDARMVRETEHQRTLTLEFTLSRVESVTPAEVTHVFPSNELLPENLLRFYVRFATSMQRGRCEAEIALLGPDGKVAPDVLYRPPIELWDESMQYLTILLDPGRLKRMVGPNRELGPPLHVGSHYALAIGPGMTDASGQRLAKTVKKRFQVTSAIRSRIDSMRWQIETPASGTRESLILTFPQPLDWALLANAVTIASSNEKFMQGQVAIDHDERRWRFTPSLNWVPGTYRIDVASDLEDVCGNSILASFDRPLRTGSQLSYERAGTSIAFHLL